MVGGGGLAEIGVEFQHFHYNELLRIYEYFDPRHMFGLNLVKISLIVFKIVFCITKI